MSGGRSSSPAPSAGGRSATSCRATCDGFTALVAAHLQALADLAWLRYRLARLSGDDDAAALARACDADQVRSALEPLATHGLDVDAFLTDLAGAVRARASLGAPPAGRDGPPN